MSEVEDDDLCPLCMEPLDITDRNFIPCQCGYQVCLWCWHHIKENTNGLCPACRTPYADQPVVAAQLDRDELVKRSKQRKLKEKADKKTQKTTINVDRKSLTNIRVIQRNLVYVIGLPPGFAKEEVLRRHEFFGQYGKIVKVVINRSQVAGERGHGSASAYITYAKREDASGAIQAVDGFWLDGRLLRASFGTTKYCNYFLRNLPCNNPDCLYLHDLGEDEDSFTKEEMQAGKAMTGFKEHAIAQVYDRSALTLTNKTVLPPPPNQLSDSMLESDSKALSVEILDAPGTLPVSSSPIVRTSSQAKSESPSPPKNLGAASPLSNGADLSSPFPSGAPSKNPWGVNSSSVGQTVTVSPFVKPEEFPTLARATSDSGRERQTDNGMEEKAAAIPNRSMAIIGSNKAKATGAIASMSESKVFGRGGLLADPDFDADDPVSSRIAQGLGQITLSGSNGSSLYSHIGSGLAPIEPQRAISPNLSDEGKRRPDPWALPTAMGRAISSSAPLEFDTDSGPVVNLGSWNNTGSLPSPKDLNSVLDPEVVAVEALKPSTESLVELLRSELPGVPISGGRPPPSTSRFAFANSEEDGPPGLRPRDFSHSVSNRRVDSGIGGRNFGSDLPFVDPAIAMIQPRSQAGLRSPSFAHPESSRQGARPYGSPQGGMTGFDRMGPQPGFFGANSTPPPQPVNNVPDDLAWLKQVLPNVKISAGTYSAVGMGMDNLYQEPLRSLNESSPSHSRMIWPSPPGYGSGSLPPSRHPSSLPFHDPAIVRAGLSAPHAESNLPRSMPPGMGRPPTSVSSRYDFGRPATGMVGNH